MIFFAFLSWVFYTIILLTLFVYALREKRMALIVFATILMVISNLRQPLFFLGVALPHPQHQFHTEEWALIGLANLILISWVLMTLLSYRINGTIAPLFAGLFPSHDPNRTPGRAPRGVLLAALPPFLISVGGTLYLINQFGGLSNFTFAVKISKDLAGAYAIRAVAAVACAMAFYGVLVSVTAHDRTRRGMPLIVCVYIAMVVMALAAVFAWGNRYTLALIMLGLIAGWHLHVRRLNPLTVLMIGLAAAAVLQGLKIIRTELFAEALGREVTGSAHDFWLSLSLSLHLVEFDALLLALRDAGSLFEFRWARDFINGLLAWVPRSIYPYKETFHIGGWFRQVYEPWTVNGWPVTTPGSWYINFAVPGIFVGAWISGLLMRTFDQAFNRISESPWQAAIGPFLGFFLFEGGVSMGFVQSWFLYAFPIYLASLWIASVSKPRWAPTASPRRAGRRHPRQKPL